MLSHRAAEHVSSLAPKGNKDAQPGRAGGVTLLSSSAWGSECPLQSCAEINHNGRWLKFACLIIIIADSILTHLGCLESALCCAQIVCLKLLFFPRCVCSLKITNSFVCFGWASFVKAEQWIKNNKQVSGIKTHVLGHTGAKLWDSKER